MSIFANAFNIGGLRFPAANSSVCEATFPLKLLDIQALLFYEFVNSFKDGHSE